MERKLAQRTAEAKRTEKAETAKASPGSVSERALSALTRLGFARSKVVHVLSELPDQHDVAGLVRAALVQLTPHLPCR